MKGAPIEQGDIVFFANKGKRRLKKLADSGEDAVTPEQ